MATKHEGRELANSRTFNKNSFNWRNRITTQRVHATRINSPQPTTCSGWRCSALARAAHVDASSGEQLRLCRRHWQAVREKFAELVEPFKAEIEQLTTRADGIRGRAKEFHEDVAAHCAAHIDELDKYEPPEADLPDELDGQLYDSRRDYWEQLEFYKSHKNGEQRRAAA